MTINEKIQIAQKYYQEGALQMAVRLCNEILQFQPDNFNILHLLGLVFYRNGDYENAINKIKKALQVNPDDPDAYYNLGNAYAEKGQLDEALICFLKATEINPELFEAYNNLGNIFMGRNQFDEGIMYYQKAIKLNPELADAYSNLGKALQEKGQLDEAITYGQKAIELNPSFAEAYSNLGVALQEKGRLDEAITYYQKALELNPNHETANFNMSLAFLLTGNFKEGWEKYEWRWKEKDFLKRSCFHQPSEFSQASWDGSSLKGKTLLIFSEQGVGDEIMFASCFQEVIEDAGVCMVECDKRLVPIFSRSFPEAVFIERLKNTHANASHLPRTDMVIPLGSLPKFLRTDLNAFPRRSYLLPDAAKVETWRNRLKTLGDGLKVGISWRGGVIPKVKHQRSIELEQWTGIISLAGVQFISLQYGDCKEELKEAKEKLGITIYDWEDVDPLKDLDNFAAQIAALDLILSVDNSTVHMAGALGKPVWVLLPYMPDWRWMLNRGDSPWYPIMRLFRESSPGKWKSVMAGIKDELLKNENIRIPI